MRAYASLDGQPCLELSPSPPWITASGSDEDLPSPRPGMMTVRGRDTGIAYEDAPAALTMLSRLLQGSTQDALV